MNAAIDYQLREEQGMLNIYEVVGGGRNLRWGKVISKKARPLDSIVLDGGICEKVIEDIERFEDSAEWYHSKGIPYRRGYLLHGPPGTGKTSFIQTIAGELKFNLCYLNISSPKITSDDILNRLLLSAPIRSIILIEDIDAIFVQRGSVISE